MNLEITKQNALKAIEMAPNEFKAALETLFGFSTTSAPANIMERVKTFADVLELCPPSPNEQILLDYNGNEGNMIRARAFMQLQFIADVLNEGWIPNWNDEKQFKYVPWFKESGSGLSLYDVALCFTGTAVGSRLCYKSIELAEFAAKQFADIYKEFLTLN